MSVPRGLLDAVSYLSPEVASQLLTTTLQNEEVAVLQRLVSHYEAQSQRSQHAFDMQQQEEEYSAEVQRLQEQLAVVGITPESLTPGGQAALRTLAEAASALGLAHADDAAIVGAWAQLSLDDQKSACMHNEVRRQAAIAEHLAAKAAALSSSMDAALTAAAERQQQENRRQDLQAATLTDIRMKHESYQSKIHSLKGALAQRGYHEELSHRAIVDASSHRDQLAASLQEAEQHVAAFYGLPASQVGAELRLRQLQAQLDADTHKLKQGFINLD